MPTQGVGDTWGANEGRDWKGDRDIREVTFLVPQTWESPGGVDLPNKGGSGAGAPSTPEQGTPSWWPVPTHQPHGPWGWLLVRHLGFL